MTVIWIEVVCDGCNDNSWGESYRQGSVQRLKERVKQCGWKTIKGKLYCPNCQQRLNEENYGVHVKRVDKNRLYRECVNPND